MKNKSVRALTLTIAILIVITVLSGCGTISSGDLIGVWSSSWEYEGKQFNSSIEFKRNGDYAKDTYSDGELASTEEGTYIIKGNKVTCQIGGNPGAMTPFEYKRGKLYNGKNAYSKESGQGESVNINGSPDDIESLLQGTWEYYNKEDDFGERFTFDNGKLKYTAYSKELPDKDTIIEGTYRITEKNIITTLNNHDEYFDYELNNGVLSFSIDYDESSGIRTYIKN